MCVCECIHATVSAITPISAPPILWGGGRRHQGVSPFYIYIYNPVGHLLGILPSGCYICAMEPSSIMAKSK